MNTRCYGASVFSGLYVGLCCMLILKTKFTVRFIQYSNFNLNLNPSPCAALVKLAYHACVIVASHMGSSVPSYSPK